MSALCVTKVRWCGVVPFVWSTMCIVRRSRLAGLPRSEEKIKQLNYGPRKSEASASTTAVLSPKECEWQFRFYTYKCNAYSNLSMLIAKYSNQNWAKEIYCVCHGVEISMKSLSNLYKHCTASQNKQQMPQSNIQCSACNKCISFSKQNNFLKNLLLDIVRSSFKRWRMSLILVLPFLCYTLGLAKRSRSICYRENELLGDGEKPGCGEAHLGPRQLGHKQLQLETTRITGRTYYKHE